MNEIYQEGTLAITDTDNISPYYFFNLYIINQAIHYIKDNISMLLWSEASDARQGYFAEEITEIDYKNKALWNGIFNESLEYIKQETIDGSAISVTNINLLKEQLYESQGLVGKYNLSPQDYEQGLEDLEQYFVSREDIEISKSIEEVRLQFIKELTEQPKILGECLEGDVISVFALGQGELKIRPLKEILNYYKPLFQNADIYNKYLSWVKACYAQQDLLPLFTDKLSKASSEDLEIATQLPPIVANDKLHDFSWLGLQHLSKMIWANKGTIITLCLTSQGAMGQILKGNTSNETLISDNNLLANQSELVPFISSNNSYVNSSINNNIRSITDDPDFNKALLEEAIKLQHDFAIKPHNINCNELQDEILSRKKRAAGGPWYDSFPDCLKFHTSIEDLSVIKEKLQKNNYRIKRASPSWLCDITQDELQDMSSLLKYASLPNGRVIQRSNNDCSTMSESNDCDQLIMLVKCDIQKLIDQHIAVNNPQHSKLAYEQLEGNYTEVKGKYNLIKRQDSSTMTAKKIDIDIILSQMPWSLKKCQTSIEKGFDDHRNDVIGKGSIAASPSWLCDITQDELQDMRDLLRYGYLPNGDAIQQSNNDCSGTNESNNSNPLIMFLKCDITNLINQHIAVKNHEYSKSAYEKLEGNYTEVQKKYNLIKRQNSSTMTERKSDLDKLSDILSQMPGIVKKCQIALEGALEEAHDKNKNIVIQICVLSITIGEINSAITKFEELRGSMGGSEDQALISGILKEVYTTNKAGPNIMKNIIKFISGLSDYDHHLIAYDELLKEMEKADKLKDPVVLTLFEQIKRYEKLVELAEIHDSGSNSWTRLADTLKSKAGDIIQGFAAAIRKGDYSGIKTYSNDYPESSYKYLPNIICNAYASNISNAEKVIAFIHNLPKIKHDVIGYPVLFDEMKSSNGLNGHELLLLAYKVKKRLNDPDITEQQKKMLEDRIYYNLPEGVKALVSSEGRKVAIISKKLVSNVLGIKANSSCNRYTCKTYYSMKTCPSSESPFSYEWEVHIHEDGRYFSFKARGASFDATSSGDIKRTNYQNSDNGLQWEVIPVDNGQYFYFKNRVNGRILDSNNLTSGPFGTGTGSCSNVHAYSQYTGSDYHKWKLNLQVS